MTRQYTAGPNPKRTQKQKILGHIKELGSISPAEAMRDYQVQRLASRIHELKADGYKIKVEYKDHPVTHVRYARYSLAGVEHVS